MRLSNRKVVTRSIAHVLERLHEFAAAASFMNGCKLNIWELN